MVEDEESDSGVAFVFVGLSLVIACLIGLTIYLIYKRSRKAALKPKIVLEDSRLSGSVQKMNGVDSMFDIENSHNGKQFDPTNERGDLVGDLTKSKRRKKANKDDLNIFDGVVDAQVEIVSDLTVPKSKSSLHENTENDYDTS